MQGTGAYLGSLDSIYVVGAVEAELWSWSRSTWGLFLRIAVAFKYLGKTTTLATKRPRTQADNCLAHTHSKENKTLPPLRLRRPQLCDVALG